MTPSIFFRLFTFPQIWKIYSFFLSWLLAELLLLFPLSLSECHALILCALWRVSPSASVLLPILAVVLLCLIARLRLAAWLIHKQGSSTSRSRDRRNISTKTATQHLSWNRWVSLIHAHAGTHTRPQSHTRTHTRNDNENETYAKTTGS